ncbi:hypothetical protein MTO96_018280 [Rhipicephalus appendiculatus]
MVGGLALTRTTPSSSAQLQHSDDKDAALPNCHAYNVEGQPGGNNDWAVIKEEPREGSDVAYSLRILHLSVPKWVQNGTDDSMVLDCGYNMNREAEPLGIKCTQRPVDARAE